jgi:MATE family multidrug resistance protein
MVPLGIGLAATVRVGLAQGAGDRAGARRAGFVACGLGAGLMLGVALLFWFAGHHLVGLFLDTREPEAAATALLAVSLLHTAAFFQLFDALQVTGISSLRGLGDTRVPMWLAAFGYWAVGFPAAAILSRATPLGPRGVWLGLALALATVALSMLVRFNRLTSPSVRPAAAQS